MLGGGYPFVLESGKGNRQGAKKLQDESATGFGVVAGRLPYFYLYDLMMDSMLLFLLYLVTLLIFQLEVYDLENMLVHKDNQ